jgi:hypothetical protein
MQKKLKKVSFNSKFDKVVKFILLVVLLSFMFSGVFERVCILICCGAAAYISTKINYANNFNLQSDIKSFVYLNNLVEYSKDNKIVYAPSIYYHTDCNTIILHFILDGSKKSMLYLDYKEQLEHLLKLTCSDVLTVKGAVTYTFSKNDIKQSIYSKIKEIELSEYDVMISDNLVWNYRDNPHALITGINKSGKTYFLNYLILSLLRTKCEVKVIDPKRADLIQLGKYLGDSVQCDPNQVLKILRVACEEMTLRHKQMNSSSNYLYGADFSHYKLTPYFIIFDELTAFMSTLDKKQTEECNKYLHQIIMMGRQCGVMIIFSMQKPEAEYIKTAIRDQLGLRVTFGNMTNDSYKMMYGDGGKNLTLTLSCKGSGFCYLDGTTRAPREFIAPFIDVNFIAEVEKLTKVDVVKVDIVKTTDSLETQQVVIA